MPSSEHQARIRFESFDLNLETRELRKNGRPVKLQDQPGKLLALLACRPGELVTRAEIEKALWREGEFVEFEHAVNTAMRKVREALGDDLEKPRFIETLPRKGYRFIAAVETSAPVEPQERADAIGHVISSNSAAETSDVAASRQPSPPITTPAAAEKSVSLSRPLARLLFLTVQAGYLAMYCAALYRGQGIEEVLAPLLAGRAAYVASLVVVIATCGIAVRLYLLASVGLNHPEAGAKFQRLFPALFVLDTLWAMSPLLLIPTIGYGLALGSIAPLAYLPFSQRTLIRSMYGQRA